MIFVTQKLRDAVTRAIAAERARYDELVAQDESNVERARHEWFIAYDRDWRTAAQGIIEKLASGVPVTLEDLPTRGRGRSWTSGDIAYYSDPRPDAPKKFIASADLLQFAAVLDAIDDERVSSSGLKDLGFGNLRKVAPFLTPEVTAQ